MKLAAVKAVGFVRGYLRAKLDRILIAKHAIALGSVGAYRRYLEGKSGIDIFTIRHIGISRAVRNGENSIICRILNSSIYLICRSTLNRCPNDIDCAQSLSRNGSGGGSGKLIYRLEARDNVGLPFIRIEGDEIGIGNGIIYSLTVGSTNHLGRGDPAIVNGSLTANLGGDVKAGCKSVLPFCADLEIASCD